MIRRKPYCGDYQKDPMQQTHEQFLRQLRKEDRDAGIANARKYICRDDRRRAGGESGGARDAASAEETVVGPGAVAQRTDCHAQGRCSTRRRVYTCCRGGRSSDVAGRAEAGAAPVGAGTRRSAGAAGAVDGHNVVSSPPTGAPAAPVFAEAGQKGVPPPP